MREGRVIVCENFRAPEAIVEVWNGKPVVASAFYKRFARKCCVASDREPHIGHRSRDAWTADIRSVRVICAAYGVSNSITDTDIGTIIITIAKAVRIVSRLIWTAVRCPSRARRNDGFGR